MIRSLHQPPDSAPNLVCKGADVAEDVSLLCEQCGPNLLCVRVSVTEAFYNVSDQESLPSVLWVKTR